VDGKIYRFETLEGRICRKLGVYYENQIKCPKNLRKLQNR